MKTFKLNKYKAFTRFKKNIGNNNQFIITALIGLKKISDEDKGKTKPAHWNPIDAKKAVDQSEIFIKKAGLVWTIDSLDVLLQEFFEEFFDYNDMFIKEDNIYKLAAQEGYSSESYRFYKINSSVYRRFSVISNFLLERKNEISEFRKISDYRNKKDNYYLPDLELVIALVDLAIQWRNNLVHSNASNRLKPNTTRILIQNKSILAQCSNGYGGLDIDETIERFKEGKHPRFKEVASLIRNTIDFGYILNAYWINSVDKSRLLNVELNELFKNIMYK